MLQHAASCDQKSMVLTKAVVNAASKMGIQQRELAEIIGVSPSSVSRLSRGTHCLDRSQKTGELSLLLVRLFRGLDAICGGDQHSLQAWLRSHNTELGGAPLDLIKDIRGLVTTADYVDAYRARV
jgi:DNA-binding XRE family transcriptional regulator